MAQTAEMFRRAATRITPMTWTKYCLALDASGNETLAESDDAASWCVLGSLVAAMHDVELPNDDRRAAVLHLLNVIGLRMDEPTDNPEPYLSTWNDAPDRTATQVRAALLSAARRLEAQL